MRRFLLAITCLLGVSIGSSKAQFYTQGDLQVNVQGQGSHDSTTCSSNLQILFFITKQNSFVGEIVEVKDPTYGTVYQSFVNTAGNTTFTNVYMAGGSYVTDDMLNNNMAMCGTPNFKVTSSTDTIYNANGFYTLQVTDPCIYGNVNGMVYIDNNSDCAYNTGDLYLNGVNVNASVHVNNGSMGAGGYTNSGSYYMTVQKSWMTSYDVYIPSIYNFIFPLSACQPLFYTGTTLPATVDFSLQCGGNIDVASYVHAPFRSRPTDALYISPRVSNVGCDTAVGSLKLILDSRVTYNASLSSVPADAVNGDTLIWNYNYLTSITGGAYWNYLLSYVYVTPNTTLNIGDTLKFYTSSTIPSNDLNPANNDGYSYTVIVNSFDPNIKSVTPKGTGAEGFIPANTDEMVYNIEFQNTGNAAALTVLVNDTLDSDLDSASIRIVATSHTMTPRWIAHNVIQFQYYNINLADSTTDEAHSHGFVTYSIKQKPNLAPGTEIKNTAYIYFDSNPAIVTNTTLNTIETPTSIKGSSNSVFAMYPNPANELVMLKLKSNASATITIVDVLGKVISNQKTNTENTSINTSALSSGIYFVSVVQNGNKITERLIVNH